MKKHEIESWAHRVIGRIEKGQPSEDARDEVKSDWLNDARKAARQLAGLANAARGEPIPWLIGVDERKGVVGAAYEELSSWWAKVRKHFDGLPPAMINVNVPHDKGTVVALQFETDQPPYVVEAPQERLEVPWREANATKSARRFQLLQILSPVASRPHVDGVEWEFKHSPGLRTIDVHGTRQERQVENWYCKVSFHLQPPPGEELTLYEDRSGCEIRPDGGADPLNVKSFEWRCPDGPVNFRDSGKRAYVSGPAVINVEVLGYVPDWPMTWGSVNAKLTLGMLGNRPPIVLHGRDIGGQKK